jgi:RNA polymerase sigma-70 factor (ECF subfamily)
VVVPPIGPDPSRSFEDFYQCQYRPVLALALVLCRDRQAAEDLTQEAFTAAHRNWDRLSGYERPDAWVRRVVANRSVSRFRRLINEHRGLSRIHSQARVVVDSPAADGDVWSLVRELPLRQAQVIALVYLEDRSMSEVAEILGIGETTAKTHLQRGRANLAARVNQDMSDEELG